MAVQNLTYTLERLLHSLSLTLHLFLVAQLLVKMMLLSRSLCWYPASMLSTGVLQRLAVQYKSSKQTVILLAYEQLTTWMAAQVRLNMCSGHSGGGAGGSAPASLHVDVVLNPLSKAAQRVAPILEWLRTSFRTSIKVW